MAKDNNGFGLNKITLFYNEHRGKYFIFYVRGPSTSFSGRIDKVEDGKLYLKPYQGTVLADDNRLAYGLIDRIARIELSDIVVEEETTEELIMAWCKQKNEANKKKAASADNPGGVS